jgi:hypothetical protein
LWLVHEYHGFAKVGNNGTLEENPLRKAFDAWFFMVATAVWVALGGVYQCAILISRRCKGDVKLMALPRWVRAMVYVTAPILMSPAILHLYAAYLRIRSRTPQEIAGVTCLTTSLKMAEVALESVPQLATQWVAVLVKVHEASGATGIDITSVVSPVQAASIATSTVAVVISTVFWIRPCRRPQFISSKHHEAASLVPLTLWLTTAIASGTTGLRFFMAGGGMYS